ncbi:MAG: TM0106 family RecB-like putative nuclease, partial [Bacteroidetes bacterium]|nr:TM0106 family RecB-like putative nuclease [Bacteroidota bacterium]
DVVSGISQEVLQKAKTQASLQIESRDLVIPEYIILPHAEGEKRGLAVLPPHSDKDVFFDIEGYPYLDGGLEYLWGNTYQDEQGNRAFKDFWAHDAAQEKQTFIDFINWVYALWIADPTMHVYHYANYEIAAIRKLMGRYGVCEEKVDNLLRNNVFVDLYNIVRHGIMIGEPSYSIKKVEHIYRGKRDTEVTGGGESIIVYENWRENPDGKTWETSAVLKSIRDYNIDDCDSTQELAQWLRREQVEHDIQYLLPDGEGEKELPEEVTEITKLRDNLLMKAESLDDDARAKLLETLAWSLEFHRRENKPVWWQLFDRLGWSELELYDDLDCLAGLIRTKKEPFLPTKRSRNFAYEYGFDPNQPYKGQGKSFYILDHENLKATCVEYDAECGTITLQNKEELPARISVIPDEYVRPDPIPSAIRSTIENLLESDFQPNAITDFLTRSRPRITGNQSGSIIGSPGEFLAQVIAASVNLDSSYLCIQGPPGAGKTYTAKHIIGELLKRRKRVGISSNSHKAIINLMNGVSEYIDEKNIEASLIKAGGDKEDPIFERNNVGYVASVKGLPLGNSVCFGGTAWAFCNEVAEGEFDYLFIDEAGQVSVANLIGMSRSCDNIILMGDQMQLGQPMKGTHPGESGMSILEYLLEGTATISNELGIFLPKTYRMHPDVCSLISNQVYDGRFEADPSTAIHIVQSSGPLITKQTGVLFVPVEHEGNTQASDEEVEQIKVIADELLGIEIWPTKDGQPRNIGWDDILFVAPYNFQVNKLRAALGKNARIGSVDKFQGQEAPVVVLSMCSSDASESPRGIDFLFSKNRMNVAVSRAQALAIIVGNPNLANTPIANLKQMELINFFCEITENTLERFITDAP